LLLMTEFFAYFSAVGQEDRDRLLRRTAVTNNARTWCLLALPMVAILMGVQLSGQASTQSNPPPSKQRKNETFLRKILRITGISASPSTLKGPGDEVKSGQIWLADLDSKKQRSLTSDGRYRSPVFVPGSGNILALRGTDLVQISPSGGGPQKLYSIDGIYKLVGFSQDDVDKVLILVAEKNGAWTVGLLSVQTGKVDSIPYDADSGEDRQMLEHLRSWDRVYGDKSISVKRQSKHSFSGPVEWTDVFLREGGNPPINISACDEVNCGQPSLSSTGKLLVFVKAESQ
jgi:hypothetical protein